MSCIEHTGYLDKRGYGQVKYKGKVQFAHRVALAKNLGVEPQTLDHVMHSCDNPACVNPEHLSEGSRAANMLDMVRKGRACAKISLEQAAEIRAAYVPFIKGVQKSNTKILAAQYGVSLKTITNIATGVHRSASSYEH